MVCAERMCKYCIRKQMKAYLCIFNVHFRVNVCVMLLKKSVYSHCGDVGYSFEAGGVTDHLVQGADDVGEAGSYVTVLLPTVQH